MGFDLVQGLDQFIQIGEILGIRTDLEVIFFQKSAHFMMIAQLLALDIANVIEKRIEVALGCNLGVEIAQRAGSGISGVFERIGCGLVIALQRRQAHDALALYLHAAGKRNRERNGADGAHLLEDLLTHFAVAARCRADKLAAFVGQIERQPIELVLQRVFLGHTGRELFHAVRPGAYCAGGLRLVQRPKPGDVPVLLKFLERFAADAVRRAVRQAVTQLFFQLHQFVKQHVVLLIRNHGVIQHIVAIGVLVQLLHELAHPVLAFHIRSSPSVQIAYPVP